MYPSSPADSRSRLIVPLAGILLLAVAVHGPLLLMQLPASSFDANTHMFFASHYARHWFDPWNPKWYGGFSQTTYPPLAHQWVALFSHVFGLTMSYMFVQLCVILLLVAGAYRYARMWTNERAASYAGIGAALLGSLAIQVYQSGQLPNIMATALTLHALPFFYEWSRSARGSALLKGVLITVSAGAAHHVTLIFGIPLFGLPVLWLALTDRDRDKASRSGVISRAAVFTALAIVLVGVVLLPYFIQLWQNPIKQMPIPHASRDNFLLVPESGMNFFIAPYGALLLAIPFIFWKGGSDRRLTPLFLGWWLTTIFALGSTTPLSHLLLGRAFEVLTFERYTFWSALMALPIAAVVVDSAIERWRRPAVFVAFTLAAASCALGVAWTVYRPINGATFNTDEVIAFLNRDGHDKFRYLTLGFGFRFAHVATFADATTVDGDYNSARQLPELTAGGSAQLFDSKFYGAQGMEALRSMLKHANQYGLKYIFVRDRYYEPLVAFAGWRRTEVYDNGNVTLWVKDDVPPAKPIESGAQPPPAWQSLAWGTLPMGFSLLAICTALLIPDRRRVATTVQFPSPAPDYILPEAK